MKKNQIRVVHKYLAIFSYALIFFCIVTMPHFEKGEPSPYFLFNNLPIAYWIGISSSVLTSLLGVFVKHNENSNRSLELSGLFSLVIYVNAIPRLMFKNNIWTDNYPYVGELYHIIKFGHIGYAHASGTPSLSLFSSQLSLITGLDYFVIAKLVPLIISLIVVPLLYLLARLFVNEKAAIVAVLTYTGINWFGVWFQRSNFSLIFLILTFYCLIKVMLSHKRSWYFFVLLFYFTLMISHPAASFFMMVIPITPLVLIWIGRFFLKSRREELSQTHRAFSSERSRSSFFFLAFLLFFGSWYGIIRNFYDFSLKKMLSSWNLGAFFAVRTAAISSQGYTADYYPIVMLKYYIVILAIMIGVTSTPLYLFNKKFNREATMVSSFFISAVFFMVGLFIMNVTGYIDRVFEYSFLVVGIFVGWFILEFTYEKRLKILIDAMKIILLGVILLLIVVLPLTMWSSSPFFYPSSTSLQLEKFVTTRSYGSVIVVGGHEELLTIAMVEKSQAVFEPCFPMYFSINTSKSYNVVGIVYHAYAYNGFLTSQPSLIQYMEEIQESYLKDPSLGFQKVYCADKWDVIYSK